MHPDRAAAAMRYRPGGRYLAVPLRVLRSRGITRYHGKICEKHFELAGERLVASRSCVACTREKLKARRPHRARQPTPRQLARAAGEHHFFAKKPCKRGHHSPRLTSTNACLECKKLTLKRFYDKRALAAEVLHQIFDVDGGV
jgi:hypothetical protein